MQAKKHLNPNHWWRNNAFFDLNEKTRRAKPKPGLEQLFELTWDQSMFVAWTYEIVRRLPNHRGIEKTMATEEIGQLRALPAFIRLNENERVALKQKLLPQLPVRLLLSKSLAPVSGYTSPLPPWSFDLTQMSTNAILKWVKRWVEGERNRCGMGRKRGSKGLASRNPVQDFKKGRWDWVEQSDPRTKGETPLTKSKNKIRERVRAKAKRHGLKYFKDVLMAVRLAPGLKLSGHRPLVVPDRNFSRVRSLTELADWLRSTRAAKATPGS